VARSKTRRESFALVESQAVDSSTAASALLEDPLNASLLQTSMDLSMACDGPPSPYKCLDDTLLIVDSQMVSSSSPFKSNQHMGSDPDDACFAFGANAEIEVNSNDNDNDNDSCNDSASNRSEDKCHLLARASAKEIISDFFTVPSGPVKAVSMLAKQYLAQIPQKPLADDTPNPALDREERLMQLLAHKEQECAALRGRLQEKDAVVQVRR
jgi:hypothetical protein